MIRLKNTGRLLTVTALAASTAMTGPLAALAQGAEGRPPAIEEAAPEAPRGRAAEPEAPAERPAPRRQREAAPEAEAPAERPAPRRQREAAPEPEADAPAERPAPRRQREAAPEAEAPAERPAPRRQREAAPEDAPQRARQAEPDAPAEEPAPRRGRERAPEPDAAPARGNAAEPGQAREPEAPAERPAPRRDRAPAPEGQAEPERPRAPADAERPPEPNGQPRRGEPREPNRPRAPGEPEAPAGERPARSADPAPDSGPARNAPQGNPAELPADAGTQNDLSNGATGTRNGAEPAARPPAAAAPGTRPAGTGETPAAPPTATPGAQPATPPVPGAQPPAAGVNPAEPLAPQTAPTDPALRGPNGAPVAPGTPPTPPVPNGALPAPGTIPGQPAPAAPGTPPTPPLPNGALPAPGTPAPGQQAVAPPPVENPRPVAADVQTAPVPAGGVATNDARVQQLAAPVQVRPITAEQGQRLEAPPQVVLPNDVRVERVGDRDVLSLVGAGIAGAAAGAAAAYFIRSDDTDRLVVDSRDVYYERLPRGLTRQIITRPNGIQVITIENEYGDVIQRSRIAADGRETVLFYDPYAEDDNRPDYYYDAGADLPPLRLEIPQDRYIVDVAQPNEELYYDTLVAPPVETVERIYSINEVRRSERIRDKVRRIDLNTINFAFGSAEIEQSEVDNLQALADAVKRVVDQNPGEVFLLEGHTDAVGSNVANLALSDRRAEAVAKALTEYFEIPAENIVTQGYGEEDLKVDTQEANRENRRVTLRRITPLVKPVETSQAN
ncbi:OmpA family protein [uncultured Aureimonas sp.]|uniref:OmpA family protein n=1 Tax=uncultured Aureimonas sp. TaxID=1604662 RepID=UPI0025DDD720|nr:OmpA family protein [uncultured Aureimonas sp.]